jgi:hypothetical protein
MLKPVSNTARSRVAAPAASSNPMLALAANQNLPNGAQMTDAPAYLDVGPLLSGFYNTTVEPHGDDALQIFYDIFHHDATCGTAVQILSLAPCRDGFSLRAGASGLTNQELEIFESNCAALNTERNLPRMLMDKFISGRCANSIIVRDNRIIDLLTYSPERTVVTHMLAGNIEPVVSAGFGGKFFRNGFASLPVDMQQVYKDIYGDNLLTTTEPVILRPQTMVLLLNEMHSSTIGVSIYRRVLPYWFYEKNMFRGTLQESIRRHRAIMQIILGDDTWTPRAEDYEIYTNAVQQAANDPHGAAIATRNGVTINEIMEGGSFWKWDDVAQTTAPFKLRAMGFPETMLQGDSVVEFTNGMMGALDILITERQQAERKLLREKALPLVAIMNGLHRSDIPSEVKAMIADPEEYETTGNDKTNVAGLEFFTRYRSDAARYLKMPTVHWNRKLAPPPDSALFDLYDKMAGYGMPIPIRMLATVGGLDLDDVIYGAKNDVNDREKLKGISDELKKFAPPPEEGGFESGMSGTSGYTSVRRTRGVPRGPRMTALARKANRIAEPRPGSYVQDAEGNSYRFDHSGKPRLVLQESVMNDRVNGNLLKAARIIRNR